MNSIDQNNSISEVFNIKESNNEEQQNQYEDDFQAYFFQQELNNQNCITSEDDQNISSQLLCYQVFQQNYELQQNQTQYQFQQQQQIYYTPQNQDYQVNYEQLQVEEQQTEYFNINNNNVEEFQQQQQQQEQYSYQQEQQEQPQYQQQQEPLQQQNAQEPKQKINEKNLATKNCYRDLISPFAKARNYEKYHEYFVLHGINKESFYKFCQEHFPKYEVSQKQFKALYRFQPGQKFYRESLFFLQLVINFHHHPYIMINSAKKQYTERQKQYQLVWLSQLLQSIDFAF